MIPDTEAPPRPSRYLVGARAVIPAGASSIGWRVVCSACTMRHSDHESWIAAYACARHDKALGCPGCQPKEGPKK